MFRRSRTKVPVNLIPPKRLRNKNSKQIEDPVEKPPEEAPNRKINTGNTKFEGLTTDITLVNKDSSSTEALLLLEKNSPQVDSFKLKSITSGKRKIEANQLSNKISCLGNAKKEDKCSNTHQPVSARKTEDEEKLHIEKDADKIVSRIDFVKKINALRTTEQNRKSMFNLISQNPTSNRLKNSEATSKQIRETEANLHDTVEKDHMDSTASLIPQIMLAANGEIILDEKSMLIDNVRVRNTIESTKHFDVVYDDDISGSNGHYKRRKKSLFWDKNETVQFYRCLQRVGADFSSMEYYFPNRSRRELKIKFKKEEKKNLVLVDKALLHPKGFYTNELETFTHKSYVAHSKHKGRNKEVQNNRKKDLKILEHSLPQKSLSKAQRTLTDADYLYENEKEQITKYKRPKSRTKANLEHISSKSELYLRSLENDYLNAKGLSSSTQNTLANDQLLDDENYPDKPVVTKESLAQDSTLNLEYVQVTIPVLNDDSAPSESIDEIDEFDISNLVFVEMIDPSNSTLTLNNIHIFYPETKELSSEPLDLPSDIIQKIKLALSPETEDMP